MKAYVRRSALIIAFAAFSLLLLFLLTQSTNEKLISKNKEVGRALPRARLPIRLKIPVIDVNAEIQNVGVTQAGEMAVPSNAFDVGWFELGPRPGEKGSAVISGHVDGKKGEAGVFKNLYKLKKGDKLHIKDDKGTSTVFVVQEKRIYDPGYAEEVFSLNGKAHLNLITCDGVWDGAKKSYSKRLVVFADIVH